jgi:hypothetical protein
MSEWQLASIATSIDEEKEHRKAVGREWAARRYGPKEKETDVEVVLTWSNPNSMPYCPDRTQAYIDGEMV